MIKKRKVLYFSMLLLFVILISITFISKTFSMLQPVKSVEIYSNNVSYQNNEAGSWKVTKSAKWTGLGKARITVDIDTILKTSNKPYKDIIMVLDVSGSMNGEKFNKVKSDSIELINSVLEDSNNKIALISFESSSTLISGLTNDKDLLVNNINKLLATDDTNYYKALVNVGEILKNYTKSSNRECIVMFLTDGYPNVDIPNEQGEYNYLKDTYPYVTFNGIQYEMGDSILDPIKKISDNQWIANMDTLNNVLFEASVAPLTYEKFTFTDYIDTNYFNISSIDSISSKIGEYSLDGNKVTWTINDELKSGDKATLTIDVTLKDEYLNTGGTYPTNTSETITSKLDTNSEDINSTLTPILQDNYVVLYDANAPGDCTVSNVPSDEPKSVFTTVKISEDKPICSGYAFKEWEIVTDNVEKINDDYFIMPEEDVTIRAVWSKLSLNKSVDGKVVDAQTLYDVIKDGAVIDNVRSEYVDSDTGIDFTSISSDTNGKGVYIRSGTENDTYPIYYYRGDIDNNNVIFANTCFKMVRTTDTGGVKMIYNGVPTNATCNNTGINTQIGTKAFNSSQTSPADVGYMYGTRYEYGAVKGAGWYYAPDVKYNNGKYTLVGKNGYKVETKSTISGKNLNYQHYTCGSSTSINCTTVRYVFYVSSVNNSPVYYITLSNNKKINDALSDMLDYNDNSSTIKGNSTTEGTVDYWYYNNIDQVNDGKGKSYSTYIEDTVYCNDRSYNNYTASGWNPDGGNTSTYLYFASYGRSSNPIVTCPRDIDKFSVSDSVGNGALDYPVGLLTEDEIRMAGASGSTNYNYYLYNGPRGSSEGTRWWSISPDYFYSTFASMWYMNYSGMFVANPVNYSNGVRPVVSLRAGVKISSGDGSSDSPYKIEEK